MLHELEALETCRIADLAADAKKIRDRLLQKVPRNAFAEPKPARGEHDPAHDFPLDDVLARKPEFVALRQAITELPREIRQAVWAVMEIGRGSFSADEWDQAMAQVSPLGDIEVVAALADEPDLHDCLRKGLYALGMVPRAGAT